MSPLHSLFEIADLRVRFFLQSIDDFAANLICQTVVVVVVGCDAVMVDVSSDRWSGLVI